MAVTDADGTAHLLHRLRQVQEQLGREPAGPGAASARFSDLLDSMGLVEFLAVLAEDCGVRPEAIEACAGHAFGTVAELAEAMRVAGILPRPRAEAVVRSAAQAAVRPAAWLAATAARLPGAVQSAAEINAALGRPASWLERHAGIGGRHLWAEEDPVAAAAEAARACLAEAGLLAEEVGALLVTSEAPPLLAGLGAALHHRLDLRPAAAALEVGGACTGFLAALWLGQRLLPQAGAVLLVAVEAPSRYLTLGPGPDGEAAALFGDGAAAGLLCAGPAGAGSLPVQDVVLAADGAAAGLLRVERSASGPVAVRMEGRALASRAVHAMAELVREVTSSRALAVTELAAVVAHGGNGRMPALLARALGLPPERVWSETPGRGNLGSASLPAAWALRRPHPRGPVAWVAAGAGLTAAAALTGPPGGVP
jgi:3-oxoacyl-[acyl-carrier-protein] synthase-3